MPGLSHLKKIYIAFVYQNPEFFQFCKIAANMHNKT